MTSSYFPPNGFYSPNPSKGLSMNMNNFFSTGSVLPSYSFVSNPSAPSASFHPSWVTGVTDFPAREKSPFEMSDYLKAYDEIAKKDQTFLKTGTEKVLKSVQALLKKNGF